MVECDSVTGIRGNRFVKSLNVKWRNVNSNWFYLGAISVAAFCIVALVRGSAGPGRQQAGVSQRLA